ncbi:hypothetical protein D3C80_1907860 [compost metagenome]
MEILPVAAALPAELHAAMGAHVFDDVDLAVLVAHQDHGALAKRGALEIAGIRDLRLEPDVVPVTAVEAAFEFTLV